MLSSHGIGWRGSQNTLDGEVAFIHWLDRGVQSVLSAIPDRRQVARRYQPIRARLYRALVGSERSPQWNFELTRLVRPCSPFMLPGSFPLPPPPFMKISDLYIHSSSSAPPLRVGVLLNDVVLERLFAEVVRDIRRSNFATVELLVLNQAERLTEEQLRPRSFGGRAWRVIRDPQLRPTLGWDLYTRLDRRYFTTEDDPLALEDGRELLAGVETLRVTPITEQFANRFPEEAVAAVRAKDLHVLLRFGFNILRGDILKAARYGVWSFHYGDNDYYRGRPAHFWEMVEGNPLSGVVLQALTEELDAGQVLVKGLFATRPGISLIRNRIQPYWGSEHMVIQKLWEVREYGWER